ncbi:MAG: Dabb family protein [Alloprevotella sp.]
MVKHIVMFQFRADVPKEVREEAAHQFKAGIEALPAIIPTIREIRVGFNVNPSEKWDICLDSAFDTLEDVKTYGAHPAHKAVAVELMQHIGARACTDFEI